MASSPRDLERVFLRACMGVGSLLLAAVASAQEPAVGRFALDRFEPTPAGDRFFNVPSGAVEGSFALRGGMSLDYARDPLVLRSERNAGVVGSVVSDQLVDHLGVSLALWNRVLLSVSMPLYLVNTGDDPADEVSAASSPSGVSLGDVRLGARVQLLGTRDGIAQLALGNYLWLPTGDPAEYTGDDGARSMPHVSFSGNARSFFYGAHLGVTIRQAVEVLDVGVGTEVGGGLAGGFELSPARLMLGAELFGSTVVSATRNGQSVEPFDGSTTNAEAHGCVRLRIGDFALGAAAGPGLTHGVGSPAVRVMTTFQYVADRSSPTTTKPSEESLEPSSGATEQPPR